MFDSKLLSQIGPKPRAFQIDLNIELHLKWVVTKSSLEVEIYEGLVRFNLL